MARCLLKALHVYGERLIDAAKVSIWNCAASAWRAALLMAALQPTTSASHQGDGAADPKGVSRTVSVLPRDDFDRDVWCVLGLPIDAVNIAAAVDAVEAAARERRRLSFVTPNVNWLVRVLRDEKTRRQVLEADLSLVDGAPLVAIARFLGAPIRRRAAGSDLFEALSLRPGFRGRRLRVFFFGGRDGSAEAAHATLAARRGGLEAAGWLNPGFGDVAAMSSDAIIAEINAADPDFIVVALGAEKGQDWIDANKHRLTAPVIAHLGAVVDFTAGAVRRAPRWLADAGLEWVWRIVEEPALWRRYAADALSLGKILALRFAPLFAFARARSGQTATAEVERRGGEVVVRLSGDLSHAGLAPVRAAFREAAASKAPVVLDVAAAQSADLAFLGLVLMLEKNLPAGALTLAAPRRRLRSLLAASAMNYPIIGPVPAHISGGSLSEALAAEAHTR